MTKIGIDKAIELAGSQKALADLLGVTQQHVSYWKNNRVPAERAHQIAVALDQQVSVYELRPDLKGKAA